MTVHAALGLPIEKLDVVVVEESRALQAFTCSMLSGYRVRRIRAFAGAEAAMQAMLGDPPHLVIADWRMQPVSGYQLLRTMHAPGMEPLAFVPFIATSSHATQRLVELSYRSGAHAFLVKPLSPLVLRQAINRILADSRELKLTKDGYVIAGAAEHLDGLRADEEAADASRARRMARMEQGPATDQKPVGRQVRRGYGAVVADKVGA